MRIIKRKSIFLLGFLATCIVTPIQANLIPEYNDWELLPSEIEKLLQLQSVDFPFIKNEGRADGRISFYKLTANGMAYITTAGELLYALNGRSEKGYNHIVGSLLEQFKGGKVNPVGLSKYSPRLSYYLGNKPRQVHTYLQSYYAVQLGEVWPGIDVSLHSKNASIGKIFEVQPGGDISSIKVEVSYADGLEVRKDGNLAIFTEIGPVIFSEPSAYQIKSGKKVPVQVTYYQVDQLTYGFKAENYDPTLALVIDPLIMIGSVAD